MKPKFKGTPGPWKICYYGHEYKELVIEKDKKPETRVANVAIQKNIQVVGQRSSYRRRPGTAGSLAENQRSTQRLGQHAHRG